jgi:hypothetical protein
MKLIYYQMADFKSSQLKLKYFLENRNLKIFQNEEDVDCYIYLDKPNYTKVFLFQIDLRQDLISISVNYVSHYKQLAVRCITQVIRNGIATPIAPMVTNKQYQKLVEFKKDKQDNQELYKWLTIIRIF